MTISIATLAGFLLGLVGGLIIAGAGLATLLWLAAGNATRDTSARRSG